MAQQARKGIIGSLFGAYGNGESRGDSAEPGQRSEAGHSVANEGRSSRPRSTGDNNLGDCPRRHAKFFLAWLQEEADRTGLVPASEVMSLYEQLMHEVGVQALGWNRVARHFGAMTNCKRHVDLVDDNGRRRRVLHYQIPTDGAVVSPVQRRRSAGAPLPDRIQQLELTCAALVEKIAVMADLLRNATIAHAGRS